MKRIHMLLSRLVTPRLRRVEALSRGTWLSVPKRWPVALFVLGPLAMAVAIFFAGTSPASAQDSGICDRTEEVQAELFRRYGWLLDVGCEGVTADHLARIPVRFDLLERTVGHRITELKAGDFAGLSIVEILGLFPKRNRFQNTPSGP